MTDVQVRDTPEVRWEPRGHQADHHRRDGSVAVSRCAGRYGRPLVTAPWPGRADAATDSDSPVAHGGARA